MTRQAQGATAPGPGELPIVGVPIGACPESKVVNSQPAGIGRVAALKGMCAWNNLGRNVVFADYAFEPLAVFDETQFPDDDEPSQYDLDVHAILDLEAASLVVVLNHLGTLRVFDTREILRRGTRSVRPKRTLDYVADLERSAVVGDRLVASRPRSQRAGGVLVSEPLLARVAAPTATARSLEADGHLESWGEVTALDALPALGDEWFAIGGGGRVSLVALRDGRPAGARWEVPVDFRPAGLLWDGRLVWAVGSELTPADVDDYDWELVRGGGFAALEPASGATVVTGSFPQDLAWGNGGAAVVLAGEFLCGLGRHGEVHLVSTSDGAALGTTAPTTSRSLGIAHAAIVGDQALFGWNRGGYELRKCGIDVLGEIIRRRRS